MKFIFFTLFAIPTLCFSQTYPKESNFAHATAEKDTLFLLADHQMSELTFEIWKKDPTWKGTCPIILFVNESQMDRLKKLYTVGVARITSTN